LRGRTDFIDLPRKEEGNAQKKKKRGLLIGPPGKRVDSTVRTRGKKKEIRKGEKKKGKEAGSNEKMLNIINTIIRHRRKGRTRKRKAQSVVIESQEKKKKRGVGKLNRRTREKKLASYNF